MIFAICGLTVEGTGTDRAGTLSIPASGDWAWAADEPVTPIAAHKIMTADRRMASVGFLIAFSLVFFLTILSALDEYRGANALDAPLQHHGSSIIPE
jgi:hypothetical protein